MVSRGRRPLESQTLWAAGEQEEKANSSPKKTTTVASENSQYTRDYKGNRYHPLLILGAPTVSPGSHTNANDPYEPDHLLRCHKISRTATNPLAPSKSTKPRTTDRRNETRSHGSNSKPAIRRLHNVFHRSPTSSENPCVFTSKRPPLSLLGTSSYQQALAVRSLIHVQKGKHMTLKEVLPRILSDRSLQLRLRSVIRCHVPRHLRFVI